MKRVVAATLALAAVALLVAGWGREPASTSASPALSGPPAPMTPPAAPRAVAGAPPADVAALEPAASLEGTTLDGELGWNPDGSLRLDLALRRRFDHVLSAIGERSLAALRTQLEASVQHLDPGRRAQVLEAFDRYTRYLQAVDALPRDLPLAERLTALHTLRVQQLGEGMARGFFEEEERLDAYAVQRRALEADGSLTPEARKLALDALEAQLPEPQRELARDFTQAQAVDALTRALDEEGASREERLRRRTEAVGGPAAQRLQTLDDERAAWARRLEAFHREKAALEPLDEVDLRALELVLQRDFTEPEQRRVRAVENLSPSAP